MEQKTNSATPTTTTQELVLRASNGEERAWRALVDRYERLVYSVPRKYRFGDEACADVFQQVFIKLHRNIHRLGDHPDLARWLLTTTYRECWRLGRERAKRSGKELDENAMPSNPVPEVLEKLEQQHQVRRALGELGGRCERLLTALFLTPHTPDYSTIAKELGMPEGSIGPTRNRCLAKLAELLKNLHFPGA